MPTPRLQQACGVVTNPQTGGLEVVVAGGGQRSSIAVNEVEIFSISDLKWRRAGLNCNKR